MPKPYFEVDSTGNVLDYYDPTGTAPVKNFNKLLCTISDILKIQDTSQKIKALCEVKELLEKSKESCNC